MGRLEATVSAGQAYYANDPLDAGNAYGDNVNEYRDYKVCTKYRNIEVAFSEGQLFRKKYYSF